MLAYYNEFDPFAAAWLRELIKAGHIAPGVVDERSIEDVKPEELAGYTQVHLFAGVGVWSYALRLAGWPDDRPVWTASCPCQPFSASGKRGGFNDERHLWPAVHWLAQECRPTVIIGEQVASKDAGPWIDLVQADLEAVGYSFGCVPFPSAGVGAPHIRDRAYWVAYSNDTGSQGRGERGHSADQRAIRPGGLVSGMADTLPARRAKRWPESRSGPIARGGSFGGLADTPRKRKCTDKPGQNSGNGKQLEGPKPGGYSGDYGEVNNPGPTNGFWRNADWLGCRDDKFRPVEPGTFPLVNGAAARVGRLRGACKKSSRVGKLKGYGNAINAEAAKIFIQSVTESLNALEG